MRQLAGNAAGGSSPPLPRRWNRQFPRLKLLYRKQTVVQADLRRGCAESQIAIGNILLSMQRHEPRDEIGDLGLLTFAGRLHCEVEFGFVDVAEIVGREVSFDQRGDGDHLPARTTGRAAIERAFLDDALKSGVARRGVVSGVGQDREMEILEGFPVIADAIENCPGVGGSTFQQIKDIGVVEDNTCGVLLVGFAATAGSRGRMARSPRPVR